MNIIEQIKALDDVYAPYWLEGRDLKALAESHERLLSEMNIVRVLAVHNLDLRFALPPTYFDAIEQAEKLTEDANGKAQT